MENIATFKTNIEEVEPIMDSPVQKASGGIPLSANFNLNAQAPLDDRQFAFTIADRDAIPPIRRWEGMTVFVAEGEGITYQLKGGIENEHWVKFGTSQATDVDGLHDVATSGDYNDLINTPTKVSQFENDSEFITLEQVPTEIAYGVEEPIDDPYKNIWFDVQEPSDVIVPEEGIFLRSAGNRRFKLCITASGRVYAEESEAEPSIFRDNIIILSDTNVRFKLCVSDDGRVYAEEAL